MAYGRYARRSRRRTTRRRPRRSTRRTNTRYRRTTTRRVTRRMPTRRILEVASTKKRDNMLTYTNVNNPRTTLTYSQQAAVLVGGSIDYQFLWAATARTNESIPGSGGFHSDNSTRESQICYMKGLRERIDIAASSARPWVWRRIVFTMKGTNNTFQAVANAGFFVLTSNGYGRLVNDMTNTQRLAVQSILFEGTRDVDWNDIYIAKTDSSLVNIKSDRTVLIKPKTTSGDIMNMSFYYPFEKNLVYADDEIGGDSNHSAWSTLGKPGMGDVLVYDMIVPGVGSTNTDTLSMNFSATLYWHEK